MKIGLYAGAAVAALLGLVQPASAGTSADVPPGLLESYSTNDPAARAVAEFAVHHPQPMWVTAQGQPNEGARALLAALDRAQLDNFASGPVLADRTRMLLASAASGDRASAAQADRLLSTALVLYAQALRTPPADIQFASSWVAPGPTDPVRLLATAAAAPSLEQFVTKLAMVNPVYAELRASAFANLQAGSAPDARVRASLDRARIAPTQKRYVMVDAASATLFMVEDGRIADRMKVIVGKPTSATPMVASTIYDATLNPYWHVPDDLMQKLIGPRIVAQGAKYVTDHNYDVLSSDAPDAVKLDPAKVDWKGVVAGTVHVRLRQRPNPANSMGQVKFAFANDRQIYLHDSPEKELFASDSRQLSNGCIRLEDAPRLARFLMGGASLPVDHTPELSVALPVPVPIYVTYLTAQPQGGSIAYVDDVYGRDRQADTGGVNVAALR